MLLWWDKAAGQFRYAKRSCRAPDIYGLLHSFTFPIWFLLFHFPLSFNLAVFEPQPPSPSRLPKHPLPKPSPQPQPQPPLLPHARARDQPSMAASLLLRAVRRRELASPLGSVRPLISPSSIAVIPFHSCSASSFVVCNIVL